MHQRPIYRIYDTVVRQVEDITPRMRRVTLQGDSLADFTSDRPGQWVKLFFDGSDKGRAFTIREWRAEACELVIDFVRHGHGLAGAWVASAIPGLPVRVAGPRSDFQHQEGRQLFLFGDETAIPAITAIVESLPPTARALAVIEVSDAAAKQKLTFGRHIHWTWLVNDRQPGSLLQAYARHLTLSPESSQIWVACECSAAHMMRCEFGRMGFDKASLHASGYWKTGEIEHVDADSDY